MTPDRTAAAPTHRRTAIWPWLVMPLVILALFTVLHNVRRSGAPGDQDSSFDGGIP